jgi:hypothetical protein
VARPATPRRPAGRRADRLDRPARRHVPADHRPAVAPSPGPAADGPAVAAPAAHSIDPATITELTPTALWALLPAAERERLGLRLSRLVLKALRPPVDASAEDC